MSSTWETTDRLPPQARARVIKNTFDHWLARIAQAKLHWAVFLPQYNSTLKSDHPNYKLLRTIVRQWSALLAHFDSTNGLNMFHISCVEQVDGTFEVMKNGMKNHLGEVSPPRTQVHTR